jgi:hypothetical protein
MAEEASGTREHPFSIEPQHQFDQLIALLSGIRMKAAQKGDSEISGEAGRATVLVQDFGAAIGEEMHELRRILIFQRDSLIAVQAALRLIETQQKKCEGPLGDALAAIGRTLG